MNDQANQVEFGGIFGRIASQQGTIELRFYPYAFSGNPSETPVLVGTFEGASFQESEMAPFIGEEMEGTFFDDRAEMLAIFQGTTIVLRAKAVKATWSSYDEADFVRRVDELNHSYERLDSALARAVQKNRRSVDLAKELLRRAQTKAQSSSKHAEKQASAIAVLERLLSHLVSDD
ncbi:MAG: hypothetical protein ABUS57_08180 [Pseudomonadota bacterium]